MVTLGHKLFQSLTVLIYNYLLTQVELPPPTHPDAGLSILQLTHKYNYTFEEHTVQTQDGYILTMFRINKSGRNVTRNKVVFMMHGLLSSATNFLLTVPDFGLGYLLADNGYDVWLGNARGNTFSRRHIRLNPEGSAFWQFSFHEIGVYDIPAKLDYILNVTGQSDVYYVGHSQGTTALFVTASERPEYIPKIRLMIAMAPVAFTAKITSILALIMATYLDTFQAATDILGYYEILPHSYESTEGLKLMCQPGQRFQNLCLLILYGNLGYSTEVDEDFLPLMVDYFPAGSGIKQIYHYLQIKRSDKFRQYDHGYFGNLLRYGRETPPNYNLSTNLPVALFYSVNDVLSTEYDVNKMLGLLRNVKFMYEVPAKRFNHMDFLFSRNAPQLLYSRIFALLDEY